MIRQFRDADIPVRRLAREQRAGPGSLRVPQGALGGADSAYADAGRLLRRGDTARARSQYYRARDLDVVRFRAPTAFDSIARAVTRQPGTTYVPVSERFASAAPGGMPGHELFLEHVHATTAGYALIARGVLRAMKAANIPRGLDTARVARVAEYERERCHALRRRDRRTHAQHAGASLAFRARSTARDYRATYARAMS